MDTEGFARYLKRIGKKDTVIHGLTTSVVCFEDFLIHHKHRSLETAVEHDIEDYAEQFEPQKVKEPLPSLALYYSFVGKEVLAQLAGDIREKALSEGRKVFKLREFRDVNLEDVARLEACGIVTVNQMLAAAKTPQLRQSPAEQSGVTPEAVLELVKLSDLTRLGAVKSVRARLYYDVGLDTPDKFTDRDAEDLRQMLIAFVEQTGFQGIASLPKELRNAIATARTLPKVVEYEQT